MFEEEAHGVDIMMAALLKSKNSLSEPYNNFILKQKKISGLKNCISDLDDQIELISDDFATSILANPDDSENIMLIYICEYDFLTKNKDKKIQECNTLEKESILKKSEGPCTQQIEVILQQLKVQRQAYHGKSFIGNHVHKMLKKKCILQLCNSVPILVYNNGFAGTSLHERSVEVGNKFDRIKWLMETLSNSSTYQLIITYF
nr:uncharacterized protein LOC105846452 [Hydra vulgaris]